MAELTPFIRALPKYDGTLCITHNQHKSYYETAEHYLLGRNGYDADEWISREDFDEAIAKDSIWEIQWYPNTPTGFCLVFGSTLERAMQLISKEGGST